MSDVNVDINDLLQTINNMRTAISSIESSKMSIEKMYQQLGVDWNDKKYRELGDVVGECKKALNDILKTMLKGEKFVCSLAKSIQEYDNVNIDGSMSGDNSFRESLRVAASGDANQRYQHCLGVLTKGTVPNGYLDIISERHDRGQTNVRRVFDYFRDKLMIQNSEYSPNQTAHYSPMNYEGHSRGVYYNATADMTNRRGAGTTYFHELGHMIDHLSTGYQNNLSNNANFGRALVEDGQHILQLYNGLPPARQQSFLRRIYSDSAHSFSDLIDATTSGQLHGAYGHSREYWNRPGSLQAEAFAHFFEASMGAEEKLELLSNFFPTAFAIFSDMIDSIQPEQYVRVLER